MVSAELNSLPPLNGDLSSHPICPYRDMGMSVGSSSRSKASIGLESPEMRRLNKEGTRFATLRQPVPSRRQASGVGGNEESHAFT